MNPKRRPKTWKHKICGPLPPRNPNKRLQNPPQRCGDQQQSDAETLRRLGDQLKKISSEQAGEISREQVEVNDQFQNDEASIPSLDNGRDSKAEALPASFEDPTAEACHRLEDQLKKISSEQADEISREQVEVNDQFQNDELLALEAIYGDDVFSFEKKRGLRAFQIRVHVDVPSDFTVSAELDSSIEELKPHNRGSSATSMCSFGVQFLPPIILTCLLPLSYPSHHPPQFTVHAKWLDGAKISSLCRMLDEIWDEQPGQEVLYQWVDWLRISSLSHLGFDNGVKLEVNDVLNNEDARAIPMTVPLEANIPTLVRYNEERCREAFLTDLHQCVICYSEYQGAEFIKLPCGHFFCVKCMETYSIIHVKEGTVTNLLCPDTTCRGFIPPGTLRRLLGSESYERWESLLLQKTLDTMSDVVYCPRCGTACLEGADDHAQCSKCFFSFCCLCRERRHIGAPCLSLEAKLSTLLMRQKSSCLKRDQHKELEQINEILNVKEALRDATQCPCCKIAVTRDSGCNKMWCTNCRHLFCYICGKEIDGLSHFKKEGGCRSLSFVVDIKLLMDLRQMPASEFPCPNCARYNAKVGDNNCITCRHCHTRYCAICLEVVRRSSQHFGPKGSCSKQQHTTTNP